MIVGYMSDYRGNAMLCSSVMSDTTYTHDLQQNELHAHNATANTPASPPKAKRHILGISVRLNISLESPDAPAALVVAAGDAEVDAEGPDVASGRVVALAWAWTDRSNDVNMVSAS